MKYTLYLTLFLLTVTAISRIAWTADTGLDSTVESAIDVNRELQETQSEIDTLVDDTQDMFQEYRSTLQQTDSLKTYNEQLEKLIAAQEETLASISKQLNGVDETQRNIVHLTLRMLTVLQEFISLDMPFLMEERMARIDTLKKMMDRPDVTLPDKYRRIMEAYLIETSYGRTIQTENESIVIDDRNYTVKLLRIGRLALLFQTLNGELSGYWDKELKQWTKLPTEYNNSIAKGILIAEKQSPPDFFRIPVPAPVHKQ